MPLKLHFAPPSQPSRAVQWLIRTHKLPVEPVLVNVRAGENTTPEYTAKNPFQTVPLLELEDGTFVTESSAILIYLVKKFNVPGELPANPEDELRVLSAMFGHDDLCRQLSALVLANVRVKLSKPDTPWDDIKAKIASNKESLQWTFRILEERLGRQQYIAGNTWTLADYNPCAELSQWEAAQRYMPEELQLANYPNVQAYLARVSARPGWDDFLAPFKQISTMIQTIA